MNGSFSSVGVHSKHHVLLRVFTFIIISVCLIFYSFASLGTGTYAADDGTSATLDTSNLSHAYDDDTETSANIFTGDGHIVYRLDTLGVYPGIPISIIMNTSDNSDHTVTIEELDVNGIELPGAVHTIDIYGHKGSYLFNLSGAAGYIRIRGVEGSALYVYDISPYDPYNEPGRFRNANNLNDAFDGNESTSANIFDSSGYITYFANTIKLHPGMDLMINMNASDGEMNSVTISAFSFDYIFSPETATQETKTINVNGFKNSYEYQVPSWAVWVRISGINGADLYIYEITEKQNEMPGDKMLYANNSEHAFDGSESTSANVFSGDGYLLYLLNRMQLHPGMKAAITMNTPDGSAADVSLTAYTFDLYFDTPTQQETVLIPIEGIKNTYEYTVPPWAAFLKIAGPADSALYVYEIREYDPAVDYPYTRYANNLEDAFDGNELTSANIFEQAGHLVFDLADLGIAPGTYTRFMMNGANGLAHDVAVETLGWAYEQMPGSEQLLSVSGYKPLVSYYVPEGARFIKVSGIADTALYIFEICPLIGSDISSLSAVNNNDGTATLHVSVKDAMGNGVSGLTEDDIEIYMAGVNTWDTLATLNNQSYWDVVFEDLGNGEYSVIFVRNGSLPYTRDWTFRVLGVEIGSVQVLVS
ncbi:MAG: hypothetical protein WC102_04365 [Saccharofermentanales bacterium]